MRGVVAALVAAALLMFTACGGDEETGSSGGSDGKAGQLTKVKVGVLPISNVAPERQSRRNASCATSSASASSRNIRRATETMLPRCLSISTPKA